MQDAAAEKNADTILKKAAQLYAKVGQDYALEDANNEFAAWMRTQNDFSGGEKAYNKIDDKGNVYRPVSMAWPNKKKHRMIILFHWYIQSRKSRAPCRREGGAIPHPQ